MSPELSMDALYNKFGRLYVKEGIIFVEDSPGEEMYIILSGKVQISQSVQVSERKGEITLDKEKPQVLAILGKGDFLGEMSLLEGKSRSATATALEETKVVVLNKGNFEQILEKQPKFALKMLKVMSRRIRETNEDLKEEEEEKGEGIKKEEEKKEEVIKEERKEVVEKKEEAPQKEPKDLKAKSPLGDYVQQITHGYSLSKILLTAHSLDLFSILEDTPQRVKSLAQSLRCNPSALELLLDSLVALRFLEKEEETYRNSKLASQFLVKDKMFYLGSYLNLWDNLGGKWSNLKEEIKVRKEDKPEDEDKERSSFREFLQDMNVNPSEVIDTLTKITDLTNCKKLLEAGESPGSYALELVQKQPSLNALVMDTSSTVKSTDEFIAQFDLGERISTQIGDYKKASFGKNNDLVFLSFTFHFPQAEDNKSLVERVGDSLNDGGLLIIHDFLLGEEKTSPLKVILFALNLLLNNSRKRVYSSDDLALSLKEAGFRIVSKTLLSDSSTLMVGRKDKVKS